MVVVVVVVVACCLSSSSLSSSSSSSLLVVVVVVVVAVVVVLFVVAVHRPKGAEHPATGREQSGKLIANKTYHARQGEVARRHHLLPGSCGI